MRKVILVSIIPFFLFSQVTSAEIFKCIDDSGTIKYQENECHDNEKSTNVKVRKIKKSGYSNTDTIKTFAEEKKIRKTQPQNRREDLIAKQKKAKEKKCKQLRRKLKSQEQALYKKCKKGFNTYCDKPALSIDSTLNRFYSTDINGYDSNKYVHFNLNGKRYKGVETPLLKIISELQANQCKFKMPS